MNKTSNFIIALIFLTVFLPTQLLSEVRERANVPVKDTWNLNDLYRSDKSWSKSTQKLVAQFDEILAYKGKLASSTSELLACLEFNSRLSKEFDRLYSYASMKSDQDTRKSKPLKANCSYLPIRAVAIFFALIWVIEYTSLPSDLTEYSSTGDCKLSKP